MNEDRTEPRTEAMLTEVVLASPHLANGNVALIPLTAQRLFYFSK